MMERDNYKFQVQETIEALDEIEAVLYNRIVNLGMEGELKEVNDSFELDEEMSFKLADFMKLKDPNVQMLLDIYSNVVHAKDKLSNLFPSNDDSLGSNEG